MDALEDFSGSNDHLIIIKGKRNKRPRLPVNRGVISSSLSGGGESGLISYAPSFNMCSDDSNESADSSTLEDENMANCLIHLAQSGGNCINQEEMKMKSYTTNKRVSEMVSDSTTNSKGGCFVYECKTCNRNFPSFQALGGHRASHKRPRILIEDQKTIFLSSCKKNLDEIHEEEVAGGKFKRLNDDPEITIKLGHKESIGNQKFAAKIHECLICGSEFSSGQALGGHMRRHRNSSNAKAREKSSPARRVFPLDLNLPAPEDDHPHPHPQPHRDLKFQFASTGPALVDCHY